MPDATNSSFIPKRTPTQKARPTRRKNFFLFSIFSYALFVASPIASGVVFIYERYTEKIFDQAVVDLDAAIQNFSEADLERVTEFNGRLVHVEELLYGQVSYAKALQLLENNITPGVQITELLLEQVEGGDIALTAKAASETFDAVLFQKEIIQKVTEVTGAEIVRFTFTPTVSETSDEVAIATDEDSDTTKPVQFELRLAFKKDSLLVTPDRSVDTTSVSDPFVVDEYVDTGSSTVPLDSNGTETDAADTVEGQLIDTTVEAGEADSADNNETI